LNPMICVVYPDVADREFHPKVQISPKILAWDNPIKPGAPKLEFPQTSAIWIKQMQTWCKLCVYISLSLYSPHWQILGQDCFINHNLVFDWRRPHGKHSGS
jgi:hypothetical protein